MSQPRISPKRPRTEVDSLVQTFGGSSMDLDEAGNNFVSTIPEVPSLDHLGKMSWRCENCKARFFEDEVIGKNMDAIDFCCKSGSMELFNPFGENGLHELSIFKGEIRGNYGVPDNFKFFGKLQEDDIGWSKKVFKDRHGQSVSPAEHYRYLAMMEKCHNPLHSSLLLSRKFFLDVWARIDQESLQGLDRLPSTHQGSYRNLQKELKTSQALFSEFGAPHWFITFTCNPKWPEIQENLVLDQGAQDRPDLIARVFKLKVDRIIDHLFEKNLLGEVKAYVLSYEWQKRGLPHIHLNLTMETEPTQEEISRLISTDYPDERDEKLYKTVEERMIEKDNSVTAYNPDLLRIFDAHINVKPCHENSIEYPHKGTNHKAYKEWNNKKDNQGFDEVEHYLQNRHFSAPEACHRLFNFPVFQRDHKVRYQVLSIHLPGQEQPTSLTKYFEMNATLSESEQLSYTRFPSKYHWDGKEWRERVESRKIYGEIAKSTDKELLALRCLLIVTPNATCFEDLLRVENYYGGVYDNKTFGRAAYYREEYKNDGWKKGAHEL